MTDLEARICRLEIWAWGGAVPERLPSLAQLGAVAPPANLLSAAKAVIAQWDTPNWKLDQPTGELINRLRIAVAEAEGIPN